jgi:hypothetical protein
MQRCAVVPHNQIALAPFMKVAKLRTGDMFYQLAVKSLSFFQRQPTDFISRVGGYE